ncbi:MAG TPA: pyrroline-5-carboxylate reductase [Roseomonas sp.]|nr:pyrroline-5-carboxylate reductase [Roseomonas sp.]
MKLGFIGVGTITAAIVEGLCKTQPEIEIILSPRNAETAAALAARYGNVRVAVGNQAVLDESEIVVLAVRPQIADEVLRALRFRGDHHVLSLIATVSLDYLRSATAPAGRVTRAVPLPMVAMQEGPTAIFPGDEKVRSLFERIGTAIVLENEAEFDVFTAATAVMASYFAFAGTVTGWMERGGISPEKARAFVGQMLQGLSRTAPERDFATLADEHQTRGGINEQVVRHVAPGGVIPDLDAALDAVLVRLKSAPPKQPD